MAKKPATQKTVETIKHDADKRKNIPTAEYQSVLKEEQQTPIRVAYERRNRDLDPQLVWRGKDEQDWSDLVVAAPPLYIQEKVHPKVLIDDLLKQTQQAAAAKPGFQLDLFADFNGIPEGADKTDFYQHDSNWSNRMILGDSLQVMASLAEREGLRGKIQCIYFDPPYGIKFNSNFQWSTTSRDVKDGKADHITREPEQVKAFRDTWRDGIHSYLTYLRDRLTVARDLLTDSSGSIFVQIGDENVHRGRGAAGAQGGQDRVRVSGAVAGNVHLCRGAVFTSRKRERRSGEAGGDLHWAGVRHGAASGPGAGGPRGRRRRLRRADCLCAQLRGAHHGVQQARPHSRTQGPDERRLAYIRDPHHGSAPRFQIRCGVLRQDRIRRPRPLAHDRSLCHRDRSRRAKKRGTSGRARLARTEANRPAS